MDSTTCYDLPHPPVLKNWAVLRGVTHADGLNDEWKRISLAYRGTAGLSPDAHGEAATLSLISVAEEYGVISTAACRLRPFLSWANTLGWTQRKLEVQHSRIEWHIWAQP